MSHPNVISFHYTLKDSEGEQIDSSHGHSPMTYLEGAGQIIPGLENELKSLKKGDKKSVVVKAVEAYGEFDDRLVFEIPRTQFPPSEKVSVGDKFRAGANPDAAAGDDEETSPVFTVTHVNDTHVGVDGNHPLAGEDLYFEVEVTDSRPASAEELQHGHAHGPEGHHHH